MSDIIYFDRLETRNQWLHCILLSPNKVTYINGLIIICVMNTLQR